MVAACRLPPGLPLLLPCAACGGAAAAGCGAEWVGACGVGAADGAACGDVAPGGVCRRRMTGEESLLYAATKGARTVYVLGSGHIIPWARATWSEWAEGKIRDLAPVDAFFENANPTEVNARHDEALRLNASFGPGIVTPTELRDRGFAHLAAWMEKDSSFSMDRDDIREKVLGNAGGGMTADANLHLGVDASLNRFVVAACNATLSYLYTIAQAEEAAVQMAQASCYDTFPGGLAGYARAVLAWQKIYQAGDMAAWYPVAVVSNDILCAGQAVVRGMNEAWAATLANSTAPRAVAV
eukprot:gene37178-5093_t